MAPNVSPYRTRVYPSQKPIHVSEQSSFKLRMNGWSTNSFNYESVLRLWKKLGSKKELKTTQLEEETQKQILTISCFQRLSQKYSPLAKETLSSLESSRQRLALLAGSVQ